LYTTNVKGVIKKAKNAKVGVFSCPIDISQTETKGTVLLHNAKEMLDFSKGEEVQLEKVRLPPPIIKLNKSNHSR
jgi:T-complex protein 1 subunit theta